MTATTPTLAEPLFRYSVSYRRDDFTGRVYRRTVTAHDTEEARRLAAIADPHYSHTVRSPRRGAEVSPPESSDPITAYKIAAENDELYGTSCNEPNHVDGCAGRVGGDHEFRDEWVQDHGGYLLVIDGGD